MEAEIRHVHQRAPVFHCRQRIRCLVPFSSWLSPETALEPEKAARPATAFLVGALGNPERFRRDVRQLGIEVRGARFFADHYRLKDQDWQDCIQDARRAGAETLITTEKDAVKAGGVPAFPSLVAVQSTEISEPDALDQVLKKSIEERL